MKLLAASWNLLQKFHDSRSAMRVVNSGQCQTRFVEKYVLFELFGLNRVSVNLDCVEVMVNQPAQFFEDLTVNSDAFLGDQFFRGPA